MCNRAEEYLKQHGITTGKYMTYKTMASHMETYAKEQVQKFCDHLNDVSLEYFDTHTLEELAAESLNKK